MSLPRATGAFGSLAIHATMLLALVIAPKPPQAEPLAGVTLQEEKSEDFDMRLLPTSDSGTGLSCEGSYTGIGLVTYGNVIYDVVPAGPADRAGVKDGDIFLNGEMFQRDQYELGKRLPLTVERQGKRLDLFVVIGRVCFEKKAGSVPHLSEGFRP